eukprot:6133413-Heterocapsa_arctica.AAC.1
MAALRGSTAARIVANSSLSILTVLPSGAAPASAGAPVLLAAPASPIAAAAAVAAAAVLTSAVAAS